MNITDGQMAQMGERESELSDSHKKRLNYMYVRTTQCNGLHDGPARVA